MAQKVELTPSERLLKLVQRAHAAPAKPAGPLPEAIDGGDWKVDEGGAARGQSYVLLNKQNPGGEMVVPLGKTEKERLYRAHELAHIAISPRGEINTELPGELVQLCEDQRVNEQLRRIGFDFSKQRMISDYEVSDALRSGVHNPESLLGLLVAAHGTADGKALEKALGGKDNEVVRVSKLIAERYYSDQAMLDSFEDSTLQAAAEIHDRAMFQQQFPDESYPGDEPSGEGEPGEGEPSEGSPSSGSPADGDAEPGEGQPGEGEPEPAGEGTPTEGKAGAKPAKPAKPAGKKPEPGKGESKEKPQYSKPALPEFHGFRPKGEPPKPQPKPGSGSGSGAPFRFKPVSWKPGEARAMPIQAFRPGIAGGGDGDQPLYGGYQKLDDLTTDEALQQAITRGTADGDAGTMRIVDMPRPNRLPNKVMGKRVREAEDGLLRNPGRLASCDPRVFARTRRKKGGGTLLIDQSGSMSLSLEQVEKIIRAIPAATVAGYSGGHSDGELHILAKNGKMTTHDGMVPYGGCNCVDAPALEWLMKQKEPRIWVSDGHVTGTGDQFRRKAAIRSALAIKKGRIARVHTISELLKTINAETKEA